MIINNVLGIIVLFHPDLAEAMINIKSLKEQVEKVLIIDNTPIESKVDYDFFDDGIICISNGENLGLAYALNQGLDYAQKNNFRYYITVDQDTCLSESAVHNMLKVFEKSKAVGSVGAHYSGKSTKLNKVQFLITSGNLTSTEVSKSVGGYNNDLFIDSIDFDFSLKIRQAGFHLYLAAGAVMHHKIGESHYIKLLFFKIKIQIHSIQRYYYISRNHYYILKKYGKFFKVFCFKKRIIFFWEKVKLFLFHPDKAQKFAEIKRGKNDRDLLFI